MMFSPECGYFNEERYDEYAPPYGMCEECYRYDICKRATTLEELLSGKMVELNFSDLSNFILDFPNSINTLMIQKTSDGYCIVVDDISVRRELERKIKNEAFKKSKYK